MNHDHLPTLEAASLSALCGYLQMIVRAGGGRIAYCYVGGIGDVPCLVGNTVYPMLLWLHWDRELGKFLPAHLTNDNTRPVETMIDLALHLPELGRAHQKAVNHKSNRQQAA